MKKSVVVLLHLGFWACYALLVLIVFAALKLSGSGPTDSNIIKLIMGFVVIPSVVAFYGFYGLLFTKFLKPQKFFLLIGAGASVSVAAALLGALYLTVLFGANFMFNDGLNSFASELFGMSVIALITGVVALVIKGFISWFEDIQLKAELTQKNHDMEMALIKTQINPHFLFNTINNIDVLIEKDASMASQYLNKLSDIMRFMLYEAKNDTIALNKELEYIEKYVDLQRIRATNHNYVHLSITGDTTGKSIAPMLFIPFIENAFKHSGNKKLEHAIEITIDISSTRLHFTCKNKYQKGTNLQHEYNGLGNDLIKKRLKLLYPNNHVLTVTDTSGVYSVELTIDLNEN